MLGWAPRRTLWRAVYRRDPPLTDLLSPRTLALRLVAYDSRVSQTLDVRRSRRAFVLRWLVYAVVIAVIVVVPPVLTVTWRREPADFTNLIQLGGLLVAAAIIVLVTVGALLGTYLPQRRPIFRDPVLRVGPDGLTVRRRLGPPPLADAADKPDADPAANAPDVAEDDADEESDWVRPDPAEPAAEPAAEQTADETTDETADETADTASEEPRPDSSTADPAVFDSVADDDSEVTAQAEQDGSFADFDVSSGSAPVAESEANPAASADTDAESEADAQAGPKSDTQAEAADSGGAANAAQPEIPGPHEVRLAWDDVAAVRVLRGFGRTRLAISPVDPDAALARLNGSDRRDGDWNNRVHGAVHVVDITGPTVTHGEILDAVTSCSRGRLRFATSRPGRARRVVRRAFHPGAS